MSQLDQAKKEAKRLLNLANAENLLYMPNLSSSKNIVALINGYKNWHEYEEVLKRKDFLHQKVDKNTVFRTNNNIYAKQEYYIQDISFNTIEYEKKPTPLVVAQPHKPVILGHSKNNNFFNKEKAWSLDHYPMMCVGATGAGKTEILLSLAKQYLDNKEGFIYFDGKGENVLYTKVFSYAQQANRLNDLFCICFMTDHQSTKSHNKLSHSIDPINPLLGNLKYFYKFFGKEIGLVIHAILKHLHIQNQLMDIQSLESILMLNNLIQWSTNQFNHIPEIKDYLKSLNLSDNSEEQLKIAIEKHAFLCETARQTVSLFKEYQYVFKTNCSIDMEDIFLKRKILVILLPSLEKKNQKASLLGNLVLAQIIAMEEKLKEYKIHTQNIVIDDFSYFANDINSFDFSSTCNNYIFGSQELHKDTAPSVDHCFINSNTIVFMKSYEAQFFPNKLKIEIFDNINDLTLQDLNQQGLSLNNVSHYISNQSEGEAVVFCKNVIEKNDTFINHKKHYYIKAITCVYLPAKRPTFVYLPEHPTKL